MYLQNFRNVSFSSFQLKKNKIKGNLKILY